MSTCSRIKVTESKPRYVGETLWYYLWSPCEPQLCGQLSEQQVQTAEEQAPSDLHWIAVRLLKDNMANNIMQRAKYYNTCALQVTIKSMHTSNAIATPDGKV